MDGTGVVAVVPWWIQVVLSMFAGLCPTFLVWWWWYPRLERNRAKRALLWQLLTRQIDPGENDWLELFGRIRIEYEQKAVESAWVAMYGSLQYSTLPGENGAQSVRIVYRSPEEIWRKKWALLRAMADETGQKLPDPTEDPVQLNPNQLQVRGDALSRNFTVPGVGSVTVASLARGDDDAS